MSNHPLPLEAGPVRSGFLIYIKADLVGETLLDGTGQVDTGYRQPLSLRRRS